MKLWWETQSARINALSLRERIFLFLSVIACCLALADAYWLSPAQTAHKQLTQRFEKQTADLQRAREELKIYGQPMDGSKALRDEVLAVKARLEEVNRNIKEVMPATAESTPLTQVLVHFLNRYEGVTLVRTTVTAPDGAVAKPAQTTAAPAAGTGVTRQGVELTVSGPYPELVRYVQTLEKALPHVRWGSMKLKSENLPPVLTLQLYLLGVPS